MIFIRVAAYKKEDAQLEVGALQLADWHRIQVIKRKRKMRLAIVFMSCLLSAFVAAEPYYPFDYPVQHPYFRGGFPYPSMAERVDQEDVNGRLFIATVTLTLSTVTTTSTAMAVTTCTTSTAALVACVAGRRRRDVVQESEKTGRGLFYDDNEADSEKGTSFLPKPNMVEESADRAVRQLAAYPILIQPGINAPENVRGGRLMMAFATSTVTATTTSTSISAIIAICSSISSFRTCG
ncbi:Uncharacterized protein APZ42_021659 [Daphnia magna]|uniref:Uncharacterized protein n=1 Tax=Daphnia magna TaxID=35525 RepID=A0A164WE26_9CRUS|nr:Uncharacterized protein APZ42_021659 [Daphnia magna]